LSINCEAQNTPVVKVHAYERDVVGGIPGTSGGPRGAGALAPTRYFIYLETAPKAQFAVEGVWMDGKYYAVETSVRKAPIRFESPVKLADDSKSIAVPATTNTVTEVVVKDVVPGKTPDSDAARRLGQGQAAVQLSYLGKSVLVPVTRFEKRDPLYLR
jgi:hypothetical protein